jgi:hypothetical protein
MFNDKCLEITVENFYLVANDLRSFWKHVLALIKMAERVLEKQDGIKLKYMPLMESTVRNAQ